MALRGPNSAEFARTVAQIGEVIDAAALAPDRWHDVCAAFQSLHPDARVLFQGHDRLAPYAMPLAGAGWEDVNLEPYFLYYASRNPWLGIWKEMATSKVEIADALLPRRVLEATEFYNDWLKPMGRADMALGLKIAHERDRVAFFCAHYDSRSHERTNEVMAPVMQALASRMRRALDCNRAVLRGQCSIPSDGLMQNLLDPALIVNSECKLVAANSAAEALIGSGMLINVRARDIVSFGLPEIDARFARSVEATCARHPGGAGSHAEFPVELAGIRLTVSVLPLASNLHSLALRGPLPYFSPAVTALVILRVLPPDRFDAVVRFRARYRLTEQEARVTNALRLGGSLVDIAKELGVTYETARAHIKSAFSKTGTHNQRELLSLLLAESARSPESTM
ncbi:MAG TPA: LuxR C-terminal-related transcriptional regulator [Bosea sp. (in: a-proteobacteria)]|jgi:DNA-binding CsgD family transcriptional regulator|uniref:helix-turn-helix transcriptional regulator n=1 Tax=Bosea sp. (in: a-proteobacteria) TaxID=1871050 RepID=UPI002E167130|nr:LuxR C-terminal-related transcriptional regulator [Bosea sp. (in: a-proteobacteria)]